MSISSELTQAGLGMNMTQQPSTAKLKATKKMKTHSTRMRWR